MGRMSCMLSTTGCTLHWTSASIVAKPSPTAFLRASESSLTYDDGSSLPMGLRRESLPQVGIAGSSVKVRYGLRVDCEASGGFVGVWGIVGGGPRKKSVGALTNSVWSVAVREGTASCSQDRMKAALQWASSPSPRHWRIGSEIDARHNAPLLCFRLSPPRSRRVLPPPRMELPPACLYSRAADGENELLAESSESWRDVDW